MAQVEITGERDENAGWAFDAQVLDDAGVLRRHELRLSWADYNLWSASGADEPAAVADAVLRFVLHVVAAADLRPRFDASLARRLAPEADETIPRLIRPLR